MRLLIHRPSTFAAAAAISLSTACAVIAQDTSSEIGYATVVEAQEALTAKTADTHSLTRPDGWLIVLERGKPSQWLFTPSGHYAHPAVVHRVMGADRDGTAYFDTSILCQ